MKIKSVLMLLLVLQSLLVALQVNQQKDTVMKKVP
jgi:hypothetical protein